MFRSGFMMVGVAALTATLLNGQERPARSAQDQGTKSITLFEGQEVVTKGGVIHESVTVETGGYSDMRISVRVDGPKITGGEVIVSSYLNSGKTALVSRHNLRGGTDVVSGGFDIKVFGSQMVVRIFMENLECESVTLSADAYLVR